jgi:hypothetical protein
MKRILSSIAFLVLFVFTSLAADITGDWKGIVKVPNGDIELTCKLKAEGDKLTGTIVSPYGEVPIIDGKIHGDDFTFKLEIGEDMIEQHGKVSGDTIVLKGVFRGSDIEHTFKRVGK